VYSNSSVKRFITPLFLKNIFFKEKEQFNNTKQNPKATGET